MSYDNNMKGAIWKNEKRESDKHPHFTGKAEIDGKEYRVAAWKRDESAPSNAPALKFAFTEIAADQLGAAENVAGVSAPNAPPVADNWDDSDSIPF